MLLTMGPTTVGCWQLNPETKADIITLYGLRILLDVGF